MSGLMPDTVDGTKRRRSRKASGTAATGEPTRPEPTPQTDASGGWPGWPPRDMLAPFVLLAVSMERAHGYMIEDYLRTLGLFGVTMSTLYRTLRQMEKEGYLQSTWEPGPSGPARRVYTLTDAGRGWLDASAAMLTAYRDTIDRFFGLYEPAFDRAGGARAPGSNATKESR